jgi:hypothetical protein
MSFQRHLSPCDYSAALLDVAAGCHSRTNSAGLTPVKFQADWYPQPERSDLRTPHCYFQRLLSRQKLLLL